MKEPDIVISHNKAGTKIALIVVVPAIPTIQGYSDECRIKTRLSGRAPSNLTRNLL